MAAVECGTRDARTGSARLAITACGLMLAAVGVLLALAAARQGLFTNLATNIAIDASDVADAVLVLAVMTCLAASGIALLDASEARHSERRWSEHLPRH